MSRLTTLVHGCTVNTHDKMKKFCTKTETMRKQHTFTKWNGAQTCTKISSSNGVNTDHSLSIVSNAATNYMVCCEYTGARSKDASREAHKTTAS